TPTFTQTDPVTLAYIGTTPSLWTTGVAALSSGLQIGSFTASPNPVPVGASLTLIAANLVNPNPGSSVTQVTFYRDANGDGVLERGTDLLLGYGTQTSTGTWTFTF